MAGQRRRAGEGRRPCSGWDPFGFHVVRKADVLRGEFPADMVGRHVVKPEEAAALADMYRLYASGAESLSGLAKWLYARGIRTRRGKEFWDVNCVRIVLMNPLYKGVAAFGRTKRVTDEGRLTQRNRHSGEVLRPATVPVPSDPATWITWEVPAMCRRRCGRPRRRACRRTGNTGAATPGASGCSPGACCAPPAAAP